VTTTPHCTNSIRYPRYITNAAEQYFIWTKGQLGHELCDSY